MIYFFHPFKYISIHAPREGSDTERRRAQMLHDISIHAPREGSDKWGGIIHPLPKRFQSTLPARGATQ